MTTNSCEDEREWVSFDDPTEERTWLFDATFLLSMWTCIYGRGCQGIDDEPDPAGHRGCCSHGAYLSDDGDRERVTAAAIELSPEHWQLATELDSPEEAVYQDDDGSWRLVISDGACIFLNRPGFEGGPGCALHRAALAHDVSPVTTKPEVCWQVPIRREDHKTETGHIFTMVREWARRDWGEGGEDFGWWCTSADEALVGTEPVYLSLADELKTICGSDVYDSMKLLFDSRRDPADIAHATPLTGPTPAEQGVTIRS